MPSSQRAVITTRSSCSSLDTCWVRPERWSMKSAACSATVAKRPRAASPAVLLHHRLPRDRPETPPRRRSSPPPAPPPTARTACSQSCRSSAPDPPTVAALSAAIATASRFRITTSAVISPPSAPASSRRAVTPPPPIFQPTPATAKIETSTPRQSARTRTVRRPPTVPSVARSTGPDTTGHADAVSPPDALITMSL